MQHYSVVGRQFESEWHSATTNVILFIFFAVGDIVSIGIPKEDRAKTDNKQLYAKLIAKPQSEHHQLLTK